MASNDHNQELFQRHRQLLETIKKTIELQGDGIIPNLPDPQKLENLSQSDRGEYLEYLRKYAEDIRNHLSTIVPQQQPKESTNLSQKKLSGRPCSQTGGTSIESQRTGPNSSNPLEEICRPPVIDINDEDEEDLYENTGPGSRIGLQTMSESGK